VVSPGIEQGRQGRTISRQSPCHLDVRFFRYISKTLRSNRRFVVPRNIKQSIELLTSASTKLREAKTFNDANEVQELTAKFASKSAEMQKLYTQYKVVDHLHSFVRRD
jgi:hypothetical protein